MRTVKPYVRIESSHFSEDVEVREVHGHERMSQLFEFDVTLITRSLLAADELLAATATLIFELRDDDHEAEPTEIRRVHGCIAEVRDLMLFNREYRSYRLRLVPRLWLATLIETLDIFMGMTIGDIIERKLGLTGLNVDEDFQLRFLQTYPEREFVVQYKETDHAFLSRLCEHQGISYCFEHSADKDVVVFSDNNDAFGTLDPERIVFTRRGEHMGVYRLEQVCAAVPKTYIQRDYNYRNPATDLTAVRSLDEGVGGGIVEYGGHFHSEQEGDYLAAVRSQEMRAQRVRFEGACDHPGLRAGVHVTVADHPSGDAPLLITEVRHELKQATALHDDVENGHYVARFAAIGKNVTYRPPRIVPKPRISGFVTGIVDAERATDSYAKVDEQGRYRVRFMFDTSDSDEGKASRAIRMMQPHIGAGYGMHFPLRPGTEVLVTFMDGDPDRPVIAGAVPNPQTMSPVSASNAERNVIRTGGGNEINLDDTVGDERIKLTTPASNTSFHLGAANNPERGAMLQTAGAMSTIASAGVTRAGGVAATFSTIAELVHSTNIISEAGFPSGIELAVQVNAVARFAMDVANSAIDAALLEIEVEEGEANTAAVRAASVAEAAQVRCQRCMLELKRALTESLTAQSISCDPSAQTQPPLCNVKYALDDYETATADADAAYLALLGVMEDRNGIIVANRAGTNRHFEVVMQNDVEAALLAYDGALYTTYAAEEDEKAWQKLLRDASRSDNPLPIPLLAGNDPRGALNKAAWIAQRNALRRAQALDANDGSQDAVGNASTRRNQLVAMLTAAHLADNDPLKRKAACVTAEDCCGASLKNARQASFDSNEAYADMLLGNTDDIYDLKDKQLELANWVDRADLASMSLTAVVALTTFVRSRTVKKNLRNFWRDANQLVNTTYASAGVAAEMPPDIADTRAAIAAGGTLSEPQYTHVIGSDKSTLVHGQRDVTVLGKTAMLLGVGTQEDDLVMKGLKATAAATMAALAVGGGAMAAGATSGYAPTGGALAGLTALATLHGLLSAKTDKAKTDEGMAAVIGARCAALLSPNITHVIGGERLGLSSKLVGINAEQIFHVQAGANSFTLMRPPQPGNAQPQAQPGQPQPQPHPGNVAPAHPQGGIRMAVRGQDGVHGLRMGQGGLRLLSAQLNPRGNFDERHGGADPCLARLSLSPFGNAVLLAGRYGMHASRQRLHVGLDPNDDEKLGGMLIRDDSVLLGLSIGAPQIECGPQSTTVSAPGSAVELGARGVRVLAAVSEFGNSLLIKDRADSPSSQRSKKAAQKQKQSRAKSRVEAPVIEEIQEYIDSSDDSDDDVFYDCVEYQGPK